MAEYQGWIMIDNKHFLATYRINGDNSCGGYQLCLKINSDHSGKYESINPHNYFGDDKFEVIKATRALSDTSIKVGDIIELYMKRAPRQKGFFFAEDGGPICRPNDYPIKFTVISCPQFSEYYGWFKIDGIRFSASYRTSGDSSCGGYRLCLKINNGADGKKQYYGHDYFGDDKYEVTTANTSVLGHGIFIGDIIELTMKHPLIRSWSCGQSESQNPVQLTVTYIS